MMKFFIQLLGIAYVAFLAYSWVEIFKNRQKRKSIIERRQEIENYYLYDAAVTDERWKVNVGLARRRHQKLLYPKVFFQDYALPYDLAFMKLFRMRNNPGPWPRSFERRHNCSMKMVRKHIMYQAKHGNYLASVNVENIEAENRCHLTLTFHNPVVPYG